MKNNRGPEGFRYLILKVQSSKFKEHRASTGPVTRCREAGTGDWLPSCVDKQRNLVRLSSGIPGMERQIKESICRLKRATQLMRAPGQLPVAAKPARVTGLRAASMSRAILPGRQAEYPGWSAKSGKAHDYREKWRNSEAGYLCRLRGSRHPARCLRPG